MDPEIAKLAARQWGNVTRQQVIGLGGDDHTIRHRVRKGLLHRVHVAVYAVGRPPQTFLERASAAVLSCGPTAALSHLSALVLWGLATSWPIPFEVLVEADIRRPGIRVHHTTTLGRGDLRTHQHIRVTSPARTLLDSAPLLTPKQLTRAVNDAQTSGLLKRHQLQDVLTRNPRHPGTKLLRPHVADASGPTRSEFEDRFKEFCKRYELPRPHFNVRVAGYEVDVLFPAHKLIVELDGWSFHRTRSSFESDRNRDASTLAAGYPTVRITWERLTREPRPEADRLQKILAART